MQLMTRLKTAAVVVVAAGACCVGAAVIASVSAAGEARQPADRKPAKSSAENTPKPAPAKKKEKWMRVQTGSATEYGRVIPEGPSEEKVDQRWPLVTYGPEAKKEFAVKREEVFEFVGKPAVSRKDGTVTITFESKGRCDATVAIEDKDGLAIRHLASGLLGANAPEPFRKDSLRQALFGTGRTTSETPSPTLPRARFGSRWG